MPRNHPVRLFSRLTVAVAVAAASPAAAQWQLDGIPYLGGFGVTVTPLVVSDGGTGSIVIFYDLMAPSSSYAQHLDAAGNGLWPGKGARLGIAQATIAIPDGQGGAIVANTTNAQRVDASGNVLWGVSGVSGGGNAITSDGAGGAFLAYQTASSPSDIFVRRIISAGTVPWNVSACSAAGTQLSPTVCPDGAGGAVVFWVDQRAGSDDLYVQRLNSSGTTLWPLNGIAVAAAANEQNAPTAIPDGASGTIVCWVDRRSGNYDIYEQHLDSGGGSLWTPSGMPLCAVAGDQVRPRIVSDGANGFIAGWVDSRFHGGSSYGDYYMQRVNFAGTAQWTPNGVPIVTNGLVQSEALITDGAGGAIVAWMDSHNNFSDQDIYTQRINPAGVMQWDTSGVLVCGLPEAQNSPSAVGNGSGGVVIAWRDSRYSSPTRGTRYDLFVQGVFANGGLGWTPNVRATLGAATDVPADEGGAVQLALTAAPFDVLNLEPRVTGYNVWRRVTQPASFRALPSMERRSAAGLTAEALPGTIIGPEVAAAVGFPPGSWQSVAYTAAAHQSSYALIAPTRADSGAAGAAREAYVVTVHTDIPDLVTLTAPDSGYSVDNLAPGTPSQLSGTRTGPTQVHLLWSPAIVSDFWHYAVYRGDSPSFVPSSANRVGQPTSATWDDAGFVAGTSHYKVTAIDRHGNESGAALLSPSELTGTEPRPVPARSYLALAGANPHRDRAIIEYGLSHSGNVRLSIYDVGGRWVRDLVNESEPAGVTRVEWAGTDREGRRVSAGVYIVRFEGPAIVRTLRVVREN